MNPSRRRALQLLGLTGFSALAGRTAWLQVVQGPGLADKARAERTLTWTNVALRGNICGRDGTILATSSVSFDIGVNQRMVAQWEDKVEQDNPTTGLPETVVVGHGPAAAADKLAPILGVDAAELGAKMVGDSTYAVIAEAVPPDTWRQIKALGIRGVEPDQRVRRTYPAGYVAGNVVGLTAEGEGRVLEGTAGIESTQDDWLRGVNGSGSMEVGRTGAQIPSGRVTETASTPGATVTLTLDPDLQVLAQQAIDKVVTAQGAEWGCCVVMEPSTGKVLVMADSRAVDPGDPTASAGRDLGARCVEAVFEPGSVGKVVTFAAALEEGAVTPEETWTVPYSWTSANGQTFIDSHPHGVERLTTAQVLAESSNVGTVQIGERVADDVRHAYMERFGWGARSGIELPGESAGLLTPPSKWDDRTRYTTMFGQGIAGTALQSAQVLATVANNGVRVAPRVIDSWTAADGTVTRQAQPEGVRVMSEATAKTLTDMLVGVTQEGGTAEEASIDGYLVAGKTGTTEIISEDATVASFVGFTPAHDPAIAAAVIVNKPSGIFGGVVAAPVFRTIALATLHKLGIAPDPSVMATSKAHKDAQAAPVDRHGASAPSGRGE
ncbi:MULTISPECIES: peptidoglycan D,D-transpeptidase FtsI family protein [Actinomyces]|uniref:Penicillin-binding protein 2 n=1 Tax=Actinomyces marmotae TaxID=2737173 RepID=A0A6M8B7W4_9ACTO|nr:MULTISPECIES: penicillin-binding protein 2 [Actinomyces]QKD79531.1 penicillin-binding protein 2 [Actinomyces marmotae]